MRIIYTAAVATAFIAGLGVAKVVAQEVAEASTEAKVIAGSLVSTDGTNAAERIVPICKLQDKFTLSKGAKGACEGNAKNMPRIIKSGKRFSSRGTGAEFNVLLANVGLALPPCENEDSDNCYWNAEMRGNGEGVSFVTIDGNTYYLSW